MSDKYKLDYPAGYLDLAPDQLAAIAHGCGPGSGWKEKIIPDWVLGVRITEPCNIHDYEYHIGGTWEDKEKADKRFLSNMTAVVLNKGGFIIIRRLRLRIIYGYYLAVKHFGGPAFRKNENI